MSSLGSSPSRQRCTAVQVFLASWVIEDQVLGFKAATSATSISSPSQICTAVQAILASGVIKALALGFNTATATSVCVCARIVARLRQLGLDPDVMVGGEGGLPGLDIVFERPGQRPLGIQVPRPPSLAAARSWVTMRSPEHAWPTPDSGPWCMESAAWNPGTICAGGGAGRSERNQHKAGTLRPSLTPVRSRSHTSRSSPMPAMQHSSSGSCRIGQHKHAAAGARKKRAICALTSMSVKCSSVGAMK